MDGLAVAERRYAAKVTERYTMRYTFDENGDVCGISIWRSNETGWEKYYFLKNLQGDFNLQKGGPTFVRPPLVYA